MTDFSKWNKLQNLAIKNVADRWRSGANAVCLVMPTGSGKTYVGSVIARQHDRVLWVAHLRELVDQAVKELEPLFGVGNVGTWMPHRDNNVRAKCIVTSIQTLRKRHPPKGVDLLVLDECHHFVAEQWSKIPHEYYDIRTLGLTATPERAGGEPLGDIFQSLVVGAKYSELLDAGVLVPWAIFSPLKDYGHDFAEDPVKAMQDIGHGGKSFAYFLNVKLAEEFRDRMAVAGIRTATVSHTTPHYEREKSMEEMRTGDLQVITNVYCMTEGVNVPSVNNILLARPFKFYSGYIQACGRAGRCAPGKTHANLIDLCGSSLRHGHPFQDWEYSLEGRGISPRSSVQSEKSEDDSERNRPVIVEDSIYLSPNSTFFPDESEVPARYLQRPHAVRAMEFEKKRGHRGRYKTKGLLKSIMGGLGE